MTLILWTQKREVSRGFVAIAITGIGLGVLEIVMLADGAWVTANHSFAF